MNWYLQQSLDYASQRSYLDDLFKIYPTIPNGIRSLDEKKWARVEKSYNSNNNAALIESLLDLEMFPLKDSYVAYLKSDREAIKRNPKTVSRLASEIRGMSIEDLYERCSRPKETNRQIGPMFNNWALSGALGFPVMEIAEFEASEERGADAILKGTDNARKGFAQRRLGYVRDKGIDLLARIGGKYIIAEAKFLTDDGGHQKGQFDDAMGILNCTAGAVKLAVIDGVPYIRSNRYMYKAITGKYQEENIMSALMLRTFLYSI